MRKGGKPKIRTDFPGRVEAKLLQDICRVRKANSVFIRQFARFGFSGAKLLLAYFGERPFGTPFLVKIAELKETQDEFDATASLQNLVQDASLAENRVFKANGNDSEDPGQWGALLYIHRGADAASSEAVAPLALREVAFAKEHEFSTSKLQETLNEVFDKLQNAHQDASVQRVDPRTHLRRYLRKDRSRSRIECILGPDAQAERVRFLGASVTNPLKYIERLPSRADLLVGRVHGDLHPDNVILDRSKVPHLIDFAWAKQRRNVLVDFALLETSLRFMAYPRPMGLPAQLRVDQLLLEQFGADEIGSMAFCTGESAHSYKRLAAAIKVIRTRAASTKGFSMENYLLTQFVLLYGLLRYNSYENYVATRALGLIATKLAKAGFVA
jgi:hypothetical protein